MTLEDRLRQTMERRAAGAHVSDDAWARIQARTGRRRRFGLALAAAVPAVLLVAVTAAVIGVEDREGEPPVIAAAPPSYDYSQPGSVLPAGRGSVEALSPDGSAVIVSDVYDPAAELGCEGMPEAVLVRAADGGRAREVLRDSRGAPLQGTVFDGPDSRVALVDICEEHLGGISVGRMTASGMIEGIAEVPSQNLKGTSFVVGWDPSGDDLFLTTLQDADDWDAERLDVADGSVSRLFRYDRGRTPGHFGVLADGRYVIADPNEERVRIQRLGAAPDREAPGQRFAIAPDGRRVAVYGQALTILTVEGAERLVMMPEGEEIMAARWSPAGDALAYITERIDPTTRDTTHTLFVLPLGGKPVRLVSEAGRYSGLSFSAKGDVLAFSRTRYDPDYDAHAFIVRFPARP